jgi:hypothetical protein
MPQALGKLPKKTAKAVHSIFWGKTRGQARCHDDKVAVRFLDIKFGLTICGSKLRLFPKHDLSMFGKSPH